VNGKGPPLPPPPLEQVTLAVLAGGAGSRMGKPKAELDVRGKPILEYLFVNLAF
jgi:molybdopterin-guanine dinucleotide biosynthesis protein A